MPNSQQKLRQWHHRQQPHQPKKWKSRVSVSIQLIDMCVLFRALKRRYDLYSWMAATYNVMLHPERNQIQPAARFRLCWWSNVHTKCRIFMFGRAIFRPNNRWVVLRHEIILTRSWRATYFLSSFIWFAFFMQIISIVDIKNAIKHHINLLKTVHFIDRSETEKKKSNSKIDCGGWMGL